MLKDLVRSNNPKLIFLFETLTFSSKLEFVRHLLGYDGCVSAIELAGVVVVWPCFGGIL